MANYQQALLSQMGASPDYEDRLAPDAATASAHRQKLAGYAADPSHPLSRIAGELSPMIGGLGPVSAPPSFAPGEPDTTPALTGQYRNRMSGVDFGKFDNPEHTTPKYQIARVLANYKPEEGFTDAVLADLNKLGIGTFASNRPGGDYLRVSGNVDPRFEGVRGSDMAIDSGKGGWTGWGGNNAEDEFGNPIDDGGGQRGGGASAFMGQAPQFPLGAQLQGDPMQRIQEALAKLGGGSGNPNIDALLKQLQGV